MHECVLKICRCVYKAESIIMFWLRISQLLLPSFDMSLFNEIL